MPELTQIETFVMTARLKSIAKVSKQLKISAAAISKQLTRLEKELKVQLLIRTTRKIELTEVGMNYFKQCERILNEVEIAYAMMSDSKEIPRGKLKVVGNRHFAASYIIPHLKEFLSKFPYIELEIELAERMPDLNVEDIDILIGMSLSATGNVIQKKIGTTSYVFCASTDYLKRFGDPKKPEDLKDHHYITHSMRTPNDELEFKGNKTIKIKPYIKVNDAEGMLKLALDGLGVIKVHRYVVKEYLENGMLHEVLSEYNQSQIPLYVAFCESRFIASKVRCFIDFFVGKVSSK